MIVVKRRAVLFAVLLSVVTGFALADTKEIQVTTKGTLSVGRNVLLYVSSPGNSASFKWSSNSGNFVGPANSASATFLPTSPGLAEVHCVVTQNGSVLMFNTVLHIEPRSAAPPRVSAKPSQARPESNKNQVTPYDIGLGGYVPSGWMPKSNGLSTELSNDNPHSAPTSRRWQYMPPKDGDGWAAVAYQFGDQNWGDKEGRNLSGKGYKELSVWARGVPDKSGRYPVIQFKAGGGTDSAKKFQASFEAIGDFITLTSEWTRYTVSLEKKNLTSVISAFTFVLRAEDNPSGATFFLDDIEYR